MWNRIFKKKKERLIKLNKVTTLIAGLNISHGQASTRFYDRRDSFRS